VSGSLSALAPPVEPEAVVSALRGLPGLGLTRLTAIVSGGTPLWCGGSDEIELLASAAPGLGLDLDVLVVASTPEELGAAATRLDGAGPNIRFAGWKEFADGGLGGRTAAMHDGFADDPANRGILRLDPDHAERMAEVALSMGGKVAIHAIGDRANDAVLDTFGKLLGRGADPAHLRIEHASVLSPGAIQRCADLGITVSVQPAFIASETTWLEKRVGPSRMDVTYPFLSLLQRGAALVGGSDCPVEPPNPWWGMAAARDRRGLAESQALDADQAMRLFAEPLGVGSSDFLVVDRDPQASTPEEMAGTRVLATFVAGELVAPAPELAFH
jgi:predicted amidohydrolase YtcJ